MHWGAMKALQKSSSENIVPKGIRTIKPRDACLPASFRRAATNVNALAVPYRHERSAAPTWSRRILGYGPDGLAVLDTFHRTALRTCASRFNALSSSERSMQWCRLSPKH